MLSEGQAVGESRETAGYRSFLLRCWRVGGTADCPAFWRFMLLETGGAKPRRAFAGLDHVAAYLHAELEGEPLPDGKTTGG